MRIRFLAILLLSVFLTFSSACNRHSTTAGPSGGRIKDQLKTAGLGNVDVSIDADKKVVSLGGKVQSAEQKDHAAQIAQDAAAGWVISNEISVEPPGVEAGARKIESNVDDSIEHNFKALVIANHWDSMDLKYHSKNGVLTLEGKAPDAATRQDIEKIAATTPNVSQVVNKIDVRH